MMIIHTARFEGKFGVGGRRGREEELIITPSGKNSDDDGGNGAHHGVFVQLGRAASL